MSTDPRQVRDSLQRQSFMRLLGAHAPVVEPGHVVIELPFREDLCQQNGYLHAGVVTSVADSACGYAALTLMPPGSDVLSVEFKVNLLSPGRGELLLTLATPAKLVTYRRWFLDQFVSQAAGGPPVWWVEFAARPVS